MKKLIIILLLQIIIFVSYDAQAQWVKTNGPFLGLVHSLAIKDTIIFAGSNSGVYYSNDYGLNWFVNQHLLNVDIMSLSVKDTTIFAGTAFYGIFRSTDNGLTWTEANAGMSTKLIHSIIIKGDDIFAGTGNSVYISKDNGANWESVNNGLNYNTRALAVSGNNLYAGTYWGAYLSTDNGTSWTPINTGMTDTTIISCFAVNGNYIYAGTDAEGIYLSTNNGNNWTAIDSGLISKTTSIYSFAVYKNNIFMSGNGGVYLSTNNGLSWKAINTGLPNTSVTSLAIMGTNLYAGTWGDSVWVRPINEIITRIRDQKLQIPALFKLEQNFPNPFNPITIIKYEIPKTSFVSIKVYNELGNELATLVNENKSAGNYSIEFNAGNLASGIYFYTMQAGSFVETKKLVLLK